MGNKDATLRIWDTERQLLFVLRGAVVFVPLGQPASCMRYRHDANSRILFPFKRKFLGLPENTQQQD